MSEPVTQDFTACPHWGQGGRYMVDPATGARVPLLTEPQTAPGTVEVMTAVAGDTLTVPETTTKKGR